MIQDTPYVLVTAAHNEEAYIEKTIEAVLSQTVRPGRWAIISDGSEDRTDDIVREYTARNPFIAFFRLEPDGGRTFARQVYAQQFGTQLLQDISYDYIGMLDADISLPSDYYEQILDRCQRRPRLGIAGGTVLDKHAGGFSRPWASDHSVAGGIQMFRRACYEDVGGYLPLKSGGQDAVAEVMARMHGWQVRSFGDLEVLHYRSTGTQGRSICGARFRSGSEEYLLGYHPLFHLAKCLHRSLERPYLIGGLLRLCGYCWSWWQRKDRMVSPEFVEYLRREQMRRIWPRTSRRIEGRASN